MVKSRNAWCLLLPALLLGGCGFFAKGETYAIPSATLRGMLLNTEVPLAIFGDAEVHSRAMEKGDDTVVWAVSEKTGKELLRFSAKLIPSGDGTTVVVDVLPPEGPNKDRVAQGLADHITIRNLYHAAMTEQIDARLEGRFFDLTQIADETALATMANISTISEQMDRASRDWGRYERDNIAKAYREEGQGATSGEFGTDYPDSSFGEPMDSAYSRD